MCLVVNDKLNQCRPIVRQLSWNRLVAECYSANEWKWPCSVMFCMYIHLFNCNKPINIYKFIMCCVDVCHQGWLKHRTFSTTGFVLLKLSGSSFFILTEREVEHTSANMEAHFHQLKQTLHKIFPWYAIKKKVKIMRRWWKLWDKKS